MSLVATVSVPATAIPLGAALDVDEDVTVTVETTVPTSTSVVPYLWVPVDVADALVDSLETEPVVTAVSIVDELEDHVLLKVSWDDRVNGLLEAIRERDAVLTGAVGTGSRWTVRLRFPSYEELSAFYRGCVERDVPVELTQVHETGLPDDETRFGLTAPQRELLVAAYDAGYFDVPRRITLVELGERLEISDSAVSQRLRRGLAALIESTIAADATDGLAGSRAASPRDRLDTDAESDP